MADVIERLHGPRPRRGVGCTSRWVWLRRRLESADVSASEWLGLQLAVVVGLAAALVAGALVQPIIGLALGGFGLVVPAVALVRWRDRRSERLMHALPPLLDLLARLLRTGLTPSQAIVRAAVEATGPIAVRLETVVLGLRLGADPDRATARLHQPGDPRPLARTAVVLGLALNEAAGAAEAFDGLAQSLRREQAVRRQALVLTAQARLSARVLSALPVGFVGVGLASGNAQTQALVTTPIGRASATVGVLLLALGFGWMQLLIARIGR